VLTRFLGLYSGTFHAEWLFSFRIGVLVLDIVFLLGVVAVFALIGVVAWAVQKL